MAYSYQEFTGDGTTQTFTIPFEYVAASEVTVYVDGTVLATTAYEFLTPSTVNIFVAPGVGQIVRLERTTNLTVRAVDFVAGAVLSEEDLDTAFIQVFNASQEATDAVASAISVDVTGTVNMNGRRVSNVADATANSDAINKGQVVAITSTQVSAANASAANAATSAIAAAASAVTAGTYASNSEASKDQSAAHALAAENTKDATEIIRITTEGYLTAANIPTSLISKAGYFLQVKNDESAYELVGSVAAPSFYGFKMAADGVSIELTYGRDADFDVDDFETWTMAENISYSFAHNDLVVNL